MQMFCGLAVIHLRRSSVRLNLVSVDLDPLWIFPTNPQMWTVLG